MMWLNGGGRQAGSWDTALFQGRAEERGCSVSWGRGSVGRKHVQGGEETVEEGQWRHTGTHTRAHTHTHTHTHTFMHGEAAIIPATVVSN